jgi:excisionase family DNA binding protein
MLIILVTPEDYKGIIGDQRPRQGSPQMKEDSLKTISVPQAGKQLGLGKNGAYAAAARGEIPVLRFGSRLRVPVAAFERMLSEAVATKAA